MDIYSVFVNVNLNAADMPVPLLWEQCLSAFLSTNPKEPLLSAIKHISAENGVLSIEAPSELAKEWFMGDFYEIFLKIAKNIDPSINQISVSAPVTYRNTPVQAPELKTPVKLKHSNFCKKYRLDNFIAETSNEFALESAKFIAAAPRAQENFLIIRGAPGLGKTHLLHAIGREAHACWAKKAVLMDADRFFKESRNGNLDMLYASDILLIDNLQNIYSFEKYQQELLKILKNLKNKGCTIVVAFNTKNKLQPIDELDNFLKMGIKCDLNSPDLRTRIAILRQKALEKGLPAAALETCWKLIAEKLGESVCSLEGAINDIAARQALLKCEVTPQMVCAIYEEKNSNGKATSIESIAAAAARAYNVSLDSLCGKSRMAKVNKPRQIAIYISRQAGFSLSKISKFFKRDVSSIVNAIKVVKNKISSETGYSLEFEINDILSAAKN